MRAFAAVFTVLCLVSNLGTASAQDGQRRIETTENADYFGFDLRTVQNIGIEDCKAICIGDDRCKAFTYNTKARWCFLKSDYNIINDFEGAIAGRIVTAAIGFDSKDNIGSQARTLLGVGDSFKQGRSPAI